MHANTTHGHTTKQTKKPAAYNSWANIRVLVRSRAYREANITICPEWDSFEEFLRDMGDKPDNKMLGRLNYNEGFNKDNCRWMTREECARKQPLNKNNTSGYPGVIVDNQSGKFRAAIYIKGKQKHLGLFDTLEEGIAARKAAEIVVSMLA